MIDMKPAFGFPIAWMIAIGCATAIVGATASADDRPLKVFVLVGQSNMQGHADVRTLPHLSTDPRTQPLLGKMVDDDGRPKVHDQISIAYLSNDGVKSGPLTTGFGANENKIGPELSFGITVQAALDEPILIIKAAWGGKSLHTDFRPPNAGPFAFTEQQLARLEERGNDVAKARAEKTDATGHYYRLTLDHVQRVLADIGRYCPQYDSDEGFEIAGIVWFQGWNDMVDTGVYPNRDQPGGYDAYSRSLAHLIGDLRRDLSAESAPFVIGVMGVGGPIEKYAATEKRIAKVHANFREAMASVASLPEFQDNVVAVRTEAFWDGELADLRRREETVQRDVRKDPANKGIDRDAMKRAQEAAFANEFTGQERETLQTGVSNYAFHYLGSAKIMARIGQGFAEALLRTSPNETLGVKADAVAR